MLIRLYIYLFFLYYNRDTTIHSLRYRRRGTIEEGRKLIELRGCRNDVDDIDDEAILDDIEKYTEGLYEI